MNKEDIGFRSYNKSTNTMMYWSEIKAARNLSKLITLDYVILMRYTGFKDSKGVCIYEGDILSDWTKTEEGLMQSRMQVFWNKKTGSWCLDNSYKQDMTCSIDLWLELEDFNYEVKGNIYQSKE